MTRYIKELWIGRASGYWNWEIKGIDKEDYLRKVEACDMFAEELKFIREFYQGLIEEGKEESDA